MPNIEELLHRNGLIREEEEEQAVGMIIQVIN